MPILVARMLSFVALVAALVLAPLAPAVAGKVGVTAAAKNEVTGSLSGRVRSLSPGAAVFSNETITTGAASSAQILLVDETSLTLGANSRLTLDRLVYDPQRKTGSMTASFAKGAFRFVSGHLPPASYTLKTGPATLGIRGTVIEGYIASNGAIILVLIEGAFDVVIAGDPPQTISVTQPGTFITISPDGVITGPSPWTGPTLDLDAGIQFALGNQGNLIEPDSDILPRWRQLNDALDGRDLNLRFPPPPPPSTPPPPSPSPE